MYTSAKDADVSSGPSTCSLTLPPKSRSSSFSASFIAADHQHPAASTNPADTLNSITTSTNNSNNTKNNLDQEYKVSNTELHPEKAHHKTQKRYSHNVENNYKTNSSKSRSLSCDMSTVSNNSSSYPPPFTSLVLPDTFDANQFVGHHTDRQSQYKSKKDISNINKSQNNKKIDNYNIYDHNTEKSYKNISGSNTHRSHDKYASADIRAWKPQENESPEQDKLYWEENIKKHNAHQVKRNSLSEREYATHLSYYETSLGRSLPNITKSHSSAKLFRHCSPLPRKPNKEANTVSEQQPVESDQMFPTTTHEARSISSFRNSVDILLVHNTNHDNQHKNATEDKRHSSMKIHTNGRLMSKSVNCISDKVTSSSYNTYKLSSEYDNMSQQRFADDDNIKHKPNNTFHTNNKKEKHASHCSSQSSLLIAPRQTRSKEQSLSSFTSLPAMSTSASTLIAADQTIHTPRSAQKSQYKSSSRNCSFARSITFNDDNTTPKLVMRHFEKDLWEWMEQLYTPVDTISLRATRGTVKVEERLSARYSFNMSFTSFSPEETKQESVMNTKQHKTEAERAIVVVKAITVPIQHLHKSRSKQQQEQQEREQEHYHEKDVEEEAVKEWEKELIKPWLSEQLRQANKMLKKNPVDNVIANTDVVKLQALLVTDKNMIQSTFKNHVKYELETANGKITRTVFLYARPYVANVCSLAEYIRNYWLVSPFTEAKDALPSNKEPFVDNEFVNSIFTLLWQVVCALCKLHEMELIHGNLKPNNVLVQRHNDTFNVYLTDYLLPLFPENYLEHLPLTLCKEINEVNNNNNSIFSARERPHRRRMIIKEKHNYARLVQTLHGSSTDLCFTYGSATPTKRAKVKEHTLQENVVQVNNNNIQKNIMSSREVNTKKSLKREEQQEEQEIYISDYEEVEEDEEEELNMLLHLTAPECVLMTCPAHSELESSLSSTTRALNSTKRNSLHKNGKSTCVEYDDNTDEAEDESDKSFDACADVGEMLAKEANTPRRWKNSKHTSVSDEHYVDAVHTHSGKRCENMLSRNNNKTTTDNEEQERIWVNETRRTEASDAYALGVLLHVMVIGYYPPLPPFQRAIRTQSTDNASFTSSVYASAQNYGNMTDECGIPHNKMKGSTSTSTSTPTPKKKESTAVYELQEPVQLEGITFQGYLWSVRNEEYIHRKYGKRGERLAVPRSYQQSLSLPSDQHKMYSLLITIIEGLLEPDVSNRMTLQRVKVMLETYVDKNTTSNKQNKLTK